MANSRFKKILVSGAKVVKALFALLAFVFLSMVRLLTGSGNATEEEDEPLSDLSGGVLNYRTGKLDDGTDPHGLQLFMIHCFTHYITFCSGYR